MRAPWRPLRHDCVCRIPSSFWAGRSPWPPCSPGSFPQASSTGATMPPPGGAWSWRRHVPPRGPARRSVRSPPLSRFLAASSPPPTSSAVVLLVGGAWVVVDRLGTLAGGGRRACRAFRRPRPLGDSAGVAVFRLDGRAREHAGGDHPARAGAAGARDAGIGVDAVTVVAMSAGAAMVGSAFGPTNPFQAGIALKLAQLPPLGRGGLRLAMFVVGLALWIGLDACGTQYGRASTTPASPRTGERRRRRPRLDGAARAHLGHRARADGGVRVWRAAARLGIQRAGRRVSRRRALSRGSSAAWGWRTTVTYYLEGMQSVLPAAFMVGVARSISLVLEDGRVVDTILNGMVDAARARAGHRRPRC